ncbi:MAG: branched-chain amino acid ABC transporter ATP-binding protein/permease [Actinomycetota bacterium]|nr:branched-chain amino acid ABC transporter ATP-binding protein/permease [Actinomycetota bacterium]
MSAGGSPAADRSGVNGVVRVRPPLAERWWAPLAGLVLVGAVFSTMPQWMPAMGFLSIDDGVTVTIYTMLALGMVLVLGYCGQLMLATNALFGVGAYGLAILALHQSLNPWAGLVVSAVAVAAAAAIIGIMVFRLTGHLLGLVTLAIGYIAYIVFETSPLTGAGTGISAGPSLSIGSAVFSGGENSFFYVCTVAALISLVVARNLVVSRTGRALRAVEANEAAAASSGVNATHYKVVAFVVGAIMASVAGSLYANYVGVVGASSFTILVTVEVLLMAVVGGLRSIWGAPFGVLAIVMFQAALQTYGPDIIHINSSYFTTIGFGLVLILVLLLLPGGLASAGKWTQRVVESRRASRRPSRRPRLYEAAASDSVVTEVPVPAPLLVGASVGGAPVRVSDPGSGREGDLGSGRPTEPVCLLQAADVTCYFDGLAALDGVSLELRAGEVVGLIGPNGAGKTTFFNCLSGHVQPSSGVVRIADVDVTGMPPYRVARHGLARTFQNIELFSDMTVLENVMVGAHLSAHAGALSAILRLPRHWRDERGLAERATNALERVEMAQHSSRAATTLPYGQQRRVEIARALAAEPHVLLLDEPAAGLSAAEAEELVELVRALAREALGVILVEHNMRALMNVADRVTVLASGRQLLTALPDEVRQDPVVIASYLGTSHVGQPARSGADPGGAPGGVSYVPGGGS